MDAQSLTAPNDFAEAWARMDTRALERRLKDEMAVVPEYRRLIRIGYGLHWELQCTQVYIGAIKRELAARKRAHA